MLFNIKSSVTTPFFLFLCFDGSFVSSFPIPVLRTFYISVLLLLLLGSRSSFHIAEFEVSKFLFFFLQKKNYNCIFLIDCFSKIDTLLFKNPTAENPQLGNENCEFLRIYLLKHYQVLRIFSQ